MISESELNALIACANTPEAISAVRKIEVEFKRERAERNIERLREEGSGLR